MKNKLLSIGLLSLLTITLFSVSGCKCNHVDVNPKDFICDLCGSKLPEPTELQIVEQPKDVTVTLPNGCSFNVEVNNEKLVKSYMWQVYNGDIPEKDGEGPFGPRVTIVKEQWLDLKDCSSGHTKTYIKTSCSNSHSDDNRYRCKITDINDRVIYSNEAHLNYSNPSFNDPMVKVGGYTLLEGESLDLSKTELGTGIINFKSRTELVLSNVNYSNALPISDNLESGTDGIMIYDETFNESKYTVTLNGDNIIHNTYWDDNYNMGGIGLNFFFGEGYIAEVEISGEGKLAITGGSHAIYCPGTLNMIGTELILNTIGSHYGTGIYAYKVILDNTKITGKVNGSIIHNKNHKPLNGSIEIKNNSVINVTARPQHPSVGGLTFKALVAEGEFTISNSEININVFVCGKEFDDTHSLLGSEILGSNNDKLQLLNSNITLTYKTDKDLEGLATSSYGIMGDVSMHYCKVNIIMDSIETINSSAIAGDYLAIAYSNVNIECRSSGKVYGIMNNSQTQFIESNISVISESYDDTSSYGIMWMDTLVQNSTFNITTNDGLAYGCFARTSTEELKFDPTYTAKHMDPSKIKVMNFTDQAVNRYSIYLEAVEKYYVIETIYSLSDITKPASSLVMQIS